MTRLAGVRAAAAALALLTTLAGCTPEDAATDSPQAGDAATDPYDALAAAMAPEDELAAIFDQTVEVDFPAELRAQPELADIVRECPAAIDGMVAVIASAMRTKIEAFRTSYRAALAKLLTAEFSHEEAREATAFYTSDLGRRMMAARRATGKFDNVERSTAADPGGQVDRAALARDQLARAEAGNATLSEADRSALRAVFEETAWGRTMRRLRGRLTAMQARSFNTLLAGERAKLEAAIEREMETQLRACE